MKFFTLPFILIAIFFIIPEFSFSASSWKKLTCPKQLYCKKAKTKRNHRQYFKHCQKRKSGKYKRKVKFSNAIQSKMGFAGKCNLKGIVNVQCQYHRPKNSSIGYYLYLPKDFCRQKFTECVKRGGKRKWKCRK